MGINVNDVFPSKYLGATDFAEGEQRLVTIAGARMEEMKDGTSKIALAFSEVEKELLLNKTNTQNIATIYGGDTDDWMGQQVVLYTTWVDYQGKSVEAVRVRAPKKPAAAKPAAAPAARKPAGPPPGHPAAFDDEVGF